MHLLEEERDESHELRDMARVTEDGRVVYPPPQADQGELFEDAGGDGDR